VKTFLAAPTHVRERLQQVIAAYHPDLLAAAARIDLIFVYAEEDEIALSCHGYPADAVIRITSSKERAVGRRDAEIVIDEDRYGESSEAERAALLDHELYHLRVKKDKHGAIEYDEHRRPRLKMRQHDREYGWFDEIARRHGEASSEIRQARSLLHAQGQLYFNLDLAKAPAPDLHGV
jgi:hypothetical protein